MGISDVPSHSAFGRPARRQSTLISMPHFMFDQQCCVAPIAGETFDSPLVLVLIEVTWAGRVTCSGWVEWRHLDKLTIT